MLLLYPGELYRLLGASSLFIVLSYHSEMEFKLFDNEEFVCNSHKDGTAIHPALLAAVDDDKKSEVLFSFLAHLAKGNVSFCLH